MKDAFKKCYSFQKVEDFLTTIHYMYQNSAIKWRESQGKGSDIIPVILKPTKVHDPIGSIIVYVPANPSCNPTIHFENRASDESNCNATDRAKYHGLLHQIRCLSFVMHVMMYINLLRPVKNLSVLLQGDYVDLVNAIDMIADAVDTYNEMSDQ